METKPITLVFPAFMSYVLFGSVLAELFLIVPTQDAYCRFKPSGVGALCHGHVELLYGDEEALKETVAFVGPVAVAIDAGQSSFQHYVSGESHHIFTAL